MQTLTENQILERIHSRTPFNARLRDGSLCIRVDEYLPLICTAFHAGTRLQADSQARLAIDDSQRMQLEDRGSDWLIELMPITLCAQDSRLEYDLGQPLKKSLRSEISGLPLWQRPPTKTMHRRGEERHQRIYRILDALLWALEEDHRHVVLFDIHSCPFEEMRDGQNKINIAVDDIEGDQWQPLLKRLQRRLGEIELPNLANRVSFGERQHGGGYTASHVSEHHGSALTIPIEIQKVFLDPGSGQPYPMVVNALQHGLHEVLFETTADASRTFPGRSLRRNDLLPAELPPEVLLVDRELKKLARGLETLLYINPINMPGEQRRFLKSQGRQAPRFRYRQLRIDPYAHREKLYRLPVDAIRDPSLRQLYRQVIDALAERIDLLVSIGTDSFLYNSLRYYGEPTPGELANARFLLHAADRPEELNGEELNSKEMVPRFQQLANDWGLKCKVELSDRLVAAAMVNNGRKALLVRRSAKVSPVELHALAHHELGVHMTTSLNAKLQPLEVFSLGLPGATHTQEGLAIFSEYLSGNLTLKRLQSLALRVISVDLMIRYGDFCRTWRTLVEDYDVDREEAFRICTRVHRGGGFTKDHLYLSGFRDALQLYRSRDIRGLFIGKTGFEFIDLIDDLLARELLTPPKHLPICLEQPGQSAPELDYLVSCIR
ncbi:N-formylglutamate amidohydrolase [Marinobacterium nitratireducens]|uniref:N-formylglutamate amidohydrolase n=1 Tax=Marinobacterium nitratireducens TaxID=518897 RepID=A0A918DT40_9GAMM|nr:flavohemoglobin expression-modulating QEGLA motif protein [Marinobacterium nitratireducens]GGO81225.1 N-formylglutamate amidohydrolase [Marinobacterium nitratireducens]